MKEPKLDDLVGRTVDTIQVDEDDNGYPFVKVFIYPYVLVVKEVGQAGSISTYVKRQGDPDEGS